MSQKGTTIVDFIIQLIIIILFVIILVWLFPTKDWLKENYFGNTYIEKETVIDDEKFISNINNMLEASKNYFGYNVNLPEKIDDNVKVTLQELVDNHVMLMLKDSKGKKCDGNSYAVITKVSNGYTIKVDLTCGKDNDYIIRTVGCDPFCQGNCNQKCTLEYQYSKKINGYFTNWSVWSAWEVNKKTESEYLKVEKKDFTSKICPSGYSLNSDKSLCVKTIKEETTVDANANKSCPSGYVFNSDKTSCVKSVNSKVEVDANISYSCPSGYSLSGTNCIKSETISSNVTSKKTCMSGYTYIGSNECQRVSTNVIGANVKGEKCSISYEFDCENGCKTIAKETCVVPSGISYNYSCPSGYVLSSNKKICTSTSSINADIKYSCTNGELSGTKCIISNDKEDFKDVIITYVCNEGNLSGNKCVIVKEKTENAKYTLKTVTMYRYSTRKYIKESVSYKWSSSREDSKLIKDGYSLTGKTRTNCK